MSEMNPKSTEQIMQPKNDVIHVGFVDLAHDVEQMATLLQRPSTKGVVLNIWKGSEQGRSLYKPNGKEDVTQVIRKFLAVISVFGGKADIKSVENEKDIPKNSTDFDGFFEILQEKCQMFSR